MKNLKELFYEELRNMFEAEQRFAQALPKWPKLTSRLGRPSKLASNNAKPKLENTEEFIEALA